MPAADGDFELSLLPEADLAGDPNPDQCIRLDVVCRDDTAEGQPLEHLSIRTTPRQLTDLLDQFRAQRYSIMQRATAQAERDAALQAHAADAAFGQPEPAADPQAELAFLERLRREMGRQL